MSEFKNAQELWGFIREHTVNRDLQRIYTTETFYKDLRRSYGQLYINGNLSDSILYKAENQINVVETALYAIRSAIEKFNESQDIIKVCREIASVEGIETDSFETRLLDATELLVKIDPIVELPNLLVELRGFCEIRREILPLREELKKENHVIGEEKLNLIKKKLLNIVPTPSLAVYRIQDIFLNEAANEIFCPLFENKVQRELNSVYEQSWKSQKNTRKDCYKKFLKLFLHQNFTFPNVSILNKLGAAHYIFLNPSIRRLELSYTDDGLFIQESFFTKRIYNLNTDEVLETQGEDYFIKGVAKYKIKIDPYNQSGWLAKYDLIDSTLECEEKFKAILDTRTILEKFREFLEASFDKILDYLNLDKSEKINSKFKPIFFVSDTGSSVSEVRYGNTESHSIFSI